MTGGRIGSTALESLEEGDQVGLFLRRQANFEPGVVKVDDGLKRVPRSIVEVWRSNVEPPQRWNLELADVDAFAGDQRTSGISRPRHEAGRVALKGVKR